MTYNHEEFVAKWKHKGARVTEVAPNVIIVIETDVDYSPDTSFMGEYTDVMAEYTIDRKEGVMYGPYVAKTYELPGSEGIEDFGDEFEEDLFVSSEGRKRLLEMALKDFVESQIDDGDMYVENRTAFLTASDYSILARDLGYSYDRNEYRFYQVSDNYAPYDNPESIKYAIEDWERHERLNDGDWCFLFVSATLYVEGEEIAHDVIGGIESDSKEDIAEVTKEMIDNLSDYKKHLNEYIASLHAKYGEAVVKFIKYTTTAKVMTEIKDDGNKLG